MQWSINGTSSDYECIVSRVKLHCSKPQNFPQTWTQWKPQYYSSFSILRTRKPIKIGLNLQNCFLRINFFHLRSRTNSAQESQQQKIHWNFPKSLIIRQLFPNWNRIRFYNAHIKREMKFRICSILKYTVDETFPVRQKLKGQPMEIEYMYIFFYVGKSITFEFP